VEEAIERLQFQEGISELNRTLQAKEADTFGGLWIEHEPDYKIVILFTRKGERTIRPYIEDKPFADRVEVRRARYTLAELETIYAQATRELAKLDFSVNISLNVSGNRVEVTVSDRKWFEDELRRVEAKLPKGVELTVVEGGSTARDKELLLTPPVPDIAFPRQKPVEGYSENMLAKLLGVLQLDGGCLYVDPFGSESPMLIIWPPELSLQVDGDQVLVIDGKGQEVVRVGDEVDMSGGSTSADNWVLQQIPSACRGVYFFADSVSPLERRNSGLYTVDEISYGEHSVLFLQYTQALGNQGLTPMFAIGKLEANDQNPCLHLRTEVMAQAITLLWPPDWSAQLEEGTIVVRDAQDQVVARMGDKVQMRGWGNPTSPNDPFNQMIDELPGDCIGISSLVDGID
jgi:hypothetical protein